MTSPLFDGAIHQLKTIFATIENEVQRLRDLDVQTSATQRQLEVLRKNEAMLTETNSGLALQVAAARAKITEAEAAAGKIIETAQRQSNNITAAATDKAKRILADVRKSTEQLVTAAAREMLDRSFGQG